MLLNSTQQVIFDSGEEWHKKPFGAMKSGETLRLRIAVSADIDAHGACVVVRFDKNGSEARYDMRPVEGIEDRSIISVWETEFPIWDTGLYWYYFEIRTEQGLIKAGKSAAGRSAVIAESPVSWQQTVYQRKYDVPEWLEGGVIYQIFVDRFYHSGSYVEMPGRITRRDWGGMPNYEPDSDGKILNNDFFGGNFRGIIEKLPYIYSLGVTCIYLSPVCEAYSNHKYDTADYMKIDPMFGTEEEFSELCSKADEYGIKVICDGVFSHTGSDSVYFDKYGHYGGNGAWNNPDSPYRQWYYFKEDGSYETWWGIDTLPQLNKSNPSYVNFICGEYGVARHWLRLGASGWRLDVADELPNSFLERLTSAVKQEKSDAAVIGEVWEDASNKTSYGERKNYFEGDKLDSVMNYPFRNAVIGFIKNGNAVLIKNTVETIMENYPSEVVNCLMNSLGTHDTERILTVLGGKELGSDPSREEQAAEHMTPAEYERSARMFMAAEVLQMTLPGVPCIYYGDEAGMQGYKDPFNRQCYPWGHEDKRLIAWTMMLIKFRREHEVYKEGSYRTTAAVRSLYAFERYDRNERIMTVVNSGRRSLKLTAYEQCRDFLTGSEFGKIVAVPAGRVMILEEIKNI